MLPQAYLPNLPVFIWKLPTEFKCSQNTGRIHRQAGPQKLQEPVFLSVQFSNIVSLTTGPIPWHHSSPSAAGSVLNEYSLSSCLTVHHPPFSAPLCLGRPKCKFCNSPYKSHCKSEDFSSFLCNVHKQRVLLSTLLLYRTWVIVIGYTHPANPGCVTDLETL